MNKVLFISIIILLFTKASNAEPELIFAQIKDTPDQVVGAEILKVVYSKIGLSIRMVDFPGKRALMESSEGRVDGEVHRIFEIGEAYPALIRVPTPINYIEPSIFSRNHNFSITNCAALKDYTIGIVRGVKHAEICTGGMKHVQVFDYSTEMIEVIDAGRIDIGITAKINGLWLSKKMDMKSVNLLSPPLSRNMVYHYLHRKHKELVFKIDKILVEMKESGELEILRKKAINKLLKDLE